MKSLSTLLTASIKERVENKQKEICNNVTSDIDMLRPYQNKAFLDLIDYMLIIGKTK